MFSFLYSFGHWIISSKTATNLQQNFQVTEMDLNASWRPSPHFTSGRGGTPIKYIIIHGTAGGSSASGVANWFMDPSSKVSTHYIVDRDGNIIQCVNEGDTAWANGRIESGADSWWSGNPNRTTISIELVKPSTSNMDSITFRQQIICFQLVERILERNPLIRRGSANASGGITGHYSISPISKANCPGTFPWSELFIYIGAEVSYIVPLTTNVITTSSATACLIV